MRRGVEVGVRNPDRGRDRLREANVLPDHVRHQVANAPTDAPARGVPSVNVKGTHDGVGVGHRLRVQSHSVWHGRNVTLLT